MTAEQDKQAARILYVEDDREVSEIVKSGLGKRYELVQWYGTGEEAVEALETATFDLIILDWQLPDIEGIEIAAKFRAAGGVTPILMLTGMDTIDNKEAGFEAGADDYLTKPFNPRELYARVNALLKRNQKPQPLFGGLSQKDTDGGQDQAPDPQRAAIREAGLPSQYRVVAQIGLGNMGIVFKADHFFLNRTVAIKVLHPFVAVDPEMVERFRREAQVISTLQHQNIVSVYECGLNESGLPYLVMEYVEGMCINDMIDRSGVFTVRRALELVSQACSAIEHAHDKGIVHRDIKPSNMIVSTAPDGSDLLKVLDFGIAKAMDRQAEQKLTKDGFMVGTALYISPEQVVGRPADQRSDVYSLGSVLYEMLTGRTPFVDDNMVQVLLRRVHEQPPSFSSFTPPVVAPKDVEQVTLTAIATEPENRFQTMKAFKNSIEDCLRML